MEDQKRQSLWRVDKEEIYSEKVTSDWTHSLFLGFLFFCTFAFRFRFLSRGMDWLSILLLAMAAFYLFYTINFRTLEIHITRDGLWLKFGIFKKAIPIRNMAAAEIDELPGVLRFGGAGIHWLFVRGRYRISFNFLEHPRVVVRLREKEGLIRDISFTTRRAEQVTTILRDLIKEGYQPTDGISSKNQNIME